MTEPAAPQLSWALLDRTIVVVPCYNEAARLRLHDFAPIIEAGFAVLFVDDGSLDSTGSLLEQHAANTPQASLLRLTTNSGKGEAVRRGLLDAIDADATIVGYLDADLSTPATEFVRLVDSLREDPARQVVLAARVGLLGRDIERRAWRHYAGRVFATFASATLGVRVYDTQCGAKVFRVTPALQAALAEPFSSRWSFDVELLGRLVRGSRTSVPVPETAFIEVPLRRWADQPGSKLGLGASVRATADLARIAWVLRHR